MTNAGDKRRLRIAMMLESDGPGGAELLTLRLSQELRQRGHVVYPVGPDSATGWLADRYAEAGFATDAISLDGRLALKGMRTLARIFRENRLDVVHSHEFEMSVRGSVVARLCGIRHIITIHGAHAVTESARRRVALKVAFSLSAAAVMVSEDTRRYMARKLGMEESRLHVVHNGVPITEGNPLPVRAELGIGAGERMLLAVGNLEVHKGHIVLLEAMKMLERENRAERWRIVIAGGRGGPELDTLLAFARENDMADRLSILLFRGDIPDLLAAADVFAMPSIWEGLPLALLEAMLAGKPVVASSVAGIPEAVEHGRTGFLCPPSDPSALAAALRPVLNDAALRTRIGSAARDRALQEFTIGAMTDSYERLYNSA